MAGHYICILYIQLITWFIMNMKLYNLFRNNSLALPLNSVCYQD